MTVLGIIGILLIGIGILAVLNLLAISLPIGIVLIVIGIMLILFDWRGPAIRRRP